MTATSFPERLARKVAPHFSVSLSILEGVTQLLRAQTETMRRIDAINERLDRLERGRSSDDG